MLNSFSSVFKAGRQKQPAAPSGSGGSLLFSGTSESNLSVANDADFRFGTGNFTIEWWQYQTDNNLYTRVFSIGTFPSTTIGVSIEGGIFYYWNGSARNMGSVSLKNAWHHIAISRSGTSTRVFINGTQKGSTISDSVNYNNTTEVLRIGNQGTTSTAAAFGGYITNFHWIKGTAKYTSNFTVPSAPLTADPNSKLLLLATDLSSATTDSSGLNKSVSVSQVSWDSRTPF